MDKIPKIGNLRNCFLLLVFSITLLELLITSTTVLQNHYVNDSWKVPKRSDNSSLLKLFRNIETIFNPRKKSFKFWTSIEDLEYSPSEEVLWPIVVFESAGRLGNCLNAYAAFVAMSHAYPNVTFGIDETTHDKVRRLLHEDTINMFPVFETDRWPFPNMDIARRIHDNDSHTHVREAIERGIEEHNTIGPGRIIYIPEYTDLKTFEGYEDQIRSAFKLKDHLREKAREYLKHLRSSHEKNLTIIGFHIRRTDHIRFYGGYYGSSLPNMTYYQKVFDYYKAEFSPVLFLIVSDDFEYISNTFAGIEDTHLKETASAEEDFAVLASCDHSAFTVGSFGFWSSFMAGGRVLYANMPNLRFVPLILDTQNKIPNFIPINP